jgi:hypothetical protein
MSLRVNGLLVRTLQMSPKSVSSGSPEEWVSRPSFTTRHLPDTTRWFPGKSATQLSALRRG